jgi:hypothetical protein
MTLCIDIHHNSIECHYAECCYAEYHDYLNVMLSVLTLNVFVLSFVRLNVVMLSVVAPFHLSILFLLKASEHPENNLAGTNTLAYFTTPSKMKKRCFKHHMGLIIKHCKAKITSVLL